MRRTFGVNSIAHKIRCNYSHRNINAINISYYVMAVDAPTNRMTTETNHKKNAFLHTKQIKPPDTLFVKWMQPSAIDKQLECEQQTSARSNEKIATKKSIYGSAKEMAWMCVGACVVIKMSTTFAGSFAIPARFYSVDIKFHG